MPHRAPTDDMPDLNGRVIDSGRLELLESLGSGAYGKVYRALDRTSPPDRQAFYAVKCLLRPALGSDQEELQRREFKIHQLVCDHPNIVTLHRVIADRDFIYVVLDLCTGGDLFTAITETRIFQNNVDLVKEMFVQLIDAVQYCHDKSVFHRDLKPENVLCTEDGSGIRLADFGLSTQNLVSRDFGCGSSYYMSPECIGQELSIGRYSTRHSDIWSLGIILTNMISGRNPWRYATIKDECFSAYLHNRDFLLQVLPISQGANSILKRIFNLNPLRRISLVELRQEILELDTFFVDEDLLDTTSPDIPQTSSQAPRDSFTVFKHGAAGSEESVSSDEVYAFNSPPDDHLPPPCSPEITITDVIEPTGTHGSAESSSGSDSDGPITPATHPTEPVVEVPDLPEGETLDQPPGYSVPRDHSPPVQLEASGKEMKPRRRHLLRKALGRLIDGPVGAR